MEHNITLKLNETQNKNLHKVAWIHGLTLEDYIFTVVFTAVSETLYNYEQAINAKPEPYLISIDDIFKFNSLFDKPPEPNEALKEVLKVYGDFKVSESGNKFVFNTDNPDIQG